MAHSEWYQSFEEAFTWNLKLYLRIWLFIIGHVSILSDHYQQNKWGLPHSGWLYSQFEQGKIGQIIKIEAIGQ